jgi:hypothetical protein
MRFLPGSTRTSLLLFALALGTAACTVDHLGPQLQGTGSALRVINAGGTPLSVVVDGTTMLASLAPASLSASIPVAPGARHVELRSSAGAALATLQLSAAASQTTLIELHSTSAQSVSASVIADTGATPAAGMSKLRVVHIASSAPAVDIWRVQPDYPSAVRLMFPFPLGAASSFVQSTPGNWSVIATPAIESWPAGSSNDPAAHAIAQLSLSITADQARTVVFMDDGAGGVKLVTVPD